MGAATGGSARAAGAEANDTLDEAIDTGMAAGGREGYRARWRDRRQSGLTAVWSESICSAWN